jgi:hypothetical protein
MRMVFEDRKPDHIKAEVIVNLSNEREHEIEIGARRLLLLVEV